MVDHVGIIEIHRGGLICQVHGVFQREVPDGERLKLGIARIHATLVLVEHLGKARGQLARSRPRCGDNHQVASSFRVLIAAQAFIGNDEIHVRRISRDHPVAGNFQAQALQPLHESSGQAVVLFHLGEHHVFREEPPVAEHIDEPQHIIFVGDAEVCADLMTFQILRVDADEDFHIVFDVIQHRDLVIWSETRQNAGGVVIIEELATHLQVELSPELLPALLDVRGLEFNVLFAVETDAIHHGFQA